MGDLCYFDEEPRPMECYGCGAGEGSLSIYDSFTGLAWCCSACKEGRGCDCVEMDRV